MALLLKTMLQGYSYLMNDLADPRAENLFLMSSPFPVIGLIGLWFMFIFKWGPEFMKDREPLNLKYIMIVYNIGQVIANIYILYYAWLARVVVSWTCTEMDYSNSYWGLTFLWFTHKYFLLKLTDLLDTVFFVLRKKTKHLSFLHVYHHFGMCFITWSGTKFVGGGHGYFLGVPNCIVHTTLYSYYLLTVYDTKYSKLLWLKKFITQLQLLQFLFLIYTFTQLLLIPGCKYPKITSFFLIPQNLFMIVLFGEFYIRTYHLEPRKKRKELGKKMQELLEKSEDVQDKKGS